MMDTALLLGAQPDIAAKDLPDVLLFEIALAKVNYIDVNICYSSAQYQTYSKSFSARRSKRRARKGGMPPSNTTK